MNSPLTSSPLVQTNSVEETERLFARELTDTRILKTEDPKCFGVNMNSFAVGKCTLSFIEYNAAFEADNGVIGNRDSTIFGFARSGSASASFSGERVLVHQNAVVFSNGAAVRQKRSAGSGEVLLKCSTQALVARLQSALDRSISNELKFKHAVPLDHGVGAHARSSLTYIMDSLVANQALLDNPLIVADFENLMLNAILSTPHNYSEELLAPGSRTNAPAIVSRAEEFIEASANLPIKMADVLAHTGASQKALLANFRKYRGYSPSQFLANTRLKLAHQRLSNPSETDSVTSIAYASGLSHLSRFAAAYQKRYGLRPSDTLKRASGKETPPQ